LRFNLLGALLMVVSIAAFVNTGSADQTVTVTTTVGATSCVSTQTSTACGGSVANYVQVLEFLLIVVLILAAVVAIYLIKLYRRTRF
jgi:beta-lactamase regulating signal transducer with metallopeptidase domain